MANNKKTSNSKNSTKKEETKNKKNVDELNVDELTNILKNNDTETIQRLEEENAPVVENVPEIVEVETAPVQVEMETKSEEDVENKHESVVEPAKPIEVKPEPENKTMESDNSPKPTNTTKNVYGYDHFGIIYSY